MKQLDVLLRGSMVCVVLQVGGCGKTEEGAGNDAASDDASRPLADLNDAEVADVCEEIWRLYEDVTPAYERGICIVETVESTSDDASCEAAVDACVDALEIVVTSGEACTESLRLADCEATVGELNECIAEQREQVERIAALQSCEDGVRGGASAEWFDDVPACERLVDRCPAAFEESPSEGDEPDAPVSTEDAPYVIEGNVDGNAVEIRPSGSLSHSTGAAGDSWSLGLAFGEAELWLWGEVDTALGLLRMPPSGSESPSWVCLDSVEIEDGTEPSTWKSSKLSTLPLCAEGERQPLDLTFEPGYAVSGTLQGEAVAWVSQGYHCYETCRFEFEAVDTAGSGRDRWMLEADTSIEPGVSKEFEHSTLIHPNGAGAVACGGGGVVSLGEDNVIQIVVDALGPLSDCPGTSVDGQLSGAF